MYKTYNTVNTVITEKQKNVTQTTCLLFCPQFVRRIIFFVLLFNDIECNCIQGGNYLE